MLRIHEIAAMAIHNNVTNIFLRMPRSCLRDFTNAIAAPKAMTKAEIITIATNAYSDKANGIFESPL